MEVETAAEMGVCPGVRRAIELVEKVAQERGGLETLGPLVHNRQVVDRLARLGVGVVNSLDELQGNIVVVSSHGVSPQVWDEIRTRGLEVVDATCPIVQNAQRGARELADLGFEVIIFGDAEHPEVQGLLGWTGGKGLVTLDEQSIVELDRHHRLGILAQTTQSPVNFAHFVSRLTGLVLPQVQELRVVNTICDATKKRQDAAEKLAGRVDLVLVVGGYNSANTRRLVEVCSAAGVETCHIETADQIESDWLKGRHRVGVTAGTSTPDRVIDEVVRRLKGVAIV